MDVSETAGSISSALVAEAAAAFGAQRRSAHSKAQISLVIPIAVRCLIPTNVNELLQHPNIDVWLSGVSEDSQAEVERCRAHSAKRGTAGC